MTINKDQIVSAVPESARIDTPEHAEMAVGFDSQEFYRRVAAEEAEGAADRRHIRMLAR